MSLGSLVAAGVAFVGGIAAAVFLPGRLSAEDVIDLEAMSTLPGLDELSEGPEPDGLGSGSGLDELSPDPV